MAKNKKLFTTVLITGASSGIGEATARLLLKNGYQVYAAARRVSHMKELEKLGATIIEMDITNVQQVNECVSKIINNSGGIDVLINNAGYGSLGSVEEVPIDEARRQFEVNVFGMAQLTQQILPYMREKQRGRIINISSVGAKIYQPLAGWYHATKFALEGLSDSMRIEVKEFGIDVVLIEPGPIRTEWDSIALDNLSKSSKNGPYHRIASGMAKNFKLFYSHRLASIPEHVAKVILKSVKASRPRTRYAAGRGAKLMLFFRKILSDRTLDRVMLRLTK